MVKIEINGQQLEAENGKMIIEVADESGIAIPRFCYHKNLSISANCRMCLVEVEKAPKPMPACATPVTDGMKIFTNSPKALSAQKAVMEFLLINHPLDCPVCDQGGECDLQDFSIGYGEGNSHYADVKRVVKDKNIGPLIATEMTRCIHCTRCVRFGQEVAGIREMGATGRGENMEIGTYIEKSIDSELSGNIIDLCPVGALTSKPFRFIARSWEMQKHDGIAVHDCVGSNVEYHTLRGEIKRVIARENNQINDSWISDRDRFAYCGLLHTERALEPMVKNDDNSWSTCSWEDALTKAAEKLKQAGSNSGALISPSASVEEMYLLQKLMRGIGSDNIDHRLQQLDCANEKDDPFFPGLGMPVKSISEQNSILLLGSNIRKEQPMIAHHIRQAVVSESSDGNASVHMINPDDYAMNFPLAETIKTTDISSELLSLAKFLISEHDVEAESAMEDLLTDIEFTEQHKQIIENMKQAEKSLIIIGSLAQSMADYSMIKVLSSFIAKNTDSKLSLLTLGANAAGAYMAGAIPHRLAALAGQTSGLSTQQMLHSVDISTYLLMGVEADKDIAGSEEAVKALTAGTTIAISSYVNDAMKKYADIILPAAVYTETSGSYVNAAGDWQSMTAIVEAAGDSKPAWKIIRVLANMLNVENMDYISSAEVKEELLKEIGSKKAEMRINWSVPEIYSGIPSQNHLAIYQIDAIVRRSEPLQQTADGRAFAN